MSYYLKESKKVKFGNYYLECIENAKTKLSSMQNVVIKDLYDISQKAGQTPGDYVKKWLGLADILVIARNNNECVGFAIANFYNSNTVFLVVSMVAGEHQHKKIGNIINRYILKYFIYFRLRKVLKILTNFYFIFRTQNPIVYYALSKHAELYPSLKNNNIPPKEKNIAIDFVKSIWPGSNFDHNKFVILDAYANAPGLKYTTATLPKCKDERINRFIRDNLKFEITNNNAQLILGKISIFKQLYILFS
ncbi:MAG: hypothetical protein ACD_46C00092G0003 [uncultured bacterium]|nr:MAG: hypothetical protein ACD_46C00092G0003 [uncultured bacterium]